MALVRLTHHLHQLFPQFRGKDVEVEASDVAGVVRALEAMAPGIAFYICDERARLRQHVHVFVGSRRITDPWKLSDPVDSGSKVFIMQALSGG